MTARTKKTPPLRAGADLAAVMDADTQRMRLACADRRPCVMTGMHQGSGPDTVVRFIERRGLLA